MKNQNIKLKIKRNHLKDYSFKLKIYNINLLLKKIKDEYVLSLKIKR